MSDISITVAPDRTPGLFTMVARLHDKVVREVTCPSHEMAMREMTATFEELIHAPDDVVAGVIENGL